MGRKLDRWAPSFVTVVTTMGMAGCDGGKDGMPTNNPPPPPPPQTATAAPTPVIARNPPAPLPEWDDLPSGHPEGATNPPSPVLELHPDGRCFKSWEGGIGGLPRDVSSKKIGGSTYQVRLLAADADEIRGKRVRCPEGASEALKAGDTESDGK